MLGKAETLIGQSTREFIIHPRVEPLRPTGCYLHGPMAPGGLYPCILVRHRMVPREGGEPEPEPELKYYRLY